MKKVIGVVMCGGNSKRMGTDKGLMLIGGLIWAKFMADKLSFLRFPVVFSINENQFDKYSSYIPDVDLIVDDNELKGPVRGLLSVHNKFPLDDVLLIACDMLQLNTETIEDLLNVYTTEGNYDYYVYQDEKYAQPFCGIYTSNGIDKLQANIMSHSITDISMQYVLDSGETKRIAIKNKDAFMNYNSGLISEL